MRFRHSAIGITFALFEPLRFALIAMEGQPAALDGDVDGVQARRTADEIVLRGQGSPGPGWLAKSCSEAIASKLASGSELRADSSAAPSAAFER